LIRILVPLSLLVAAGVVASLAPAPASAVDTDLPALVRSYLWPSDAAEWAEAERQVKENGALRDLSRMAWLDLEEIMRRGPAGERFTVSADRTTRQEFSVSVPHGPEVPVIVQLPPAYRPDFEWPLLFAMHGGPPGRIDQARAGAERMVKVWTEAAGRAGWIIAAPAMTPSVTAGPRTEQRLPYEVFHPEQAKAVIDAVRARYPINPDRIVSTGISLGSNYSIAFAAARPGWLSAIVPVSTEGDSRELLLRNMNATPVYVLEGTQDKNIRGIGGPRALYEILTRFGYDLVYREFGDRAHEGFQEHYDDALRWLDARPRQVYPREVLRVPHPGIMGLDRRVYWIESDTRQGLIRASVAGPNRIEITARWTPAVTVYLHDRLVNLDLPVEIVVNGTRAFASRVSRSAATALEQARFLADERRIYAAAVRVEIPSTPTARVAPEKLSASVTPVSPSGQLSFWEMYAARALEERFPEVGFAGHEVPLPAGVPAFPERVAIRVTSVRPGTAVSRAGLRPGDLVVEFGGEPFFAGRGGVSGLHAWLVRELRATPDPYRLTVVRDRRQMELTAELRLGPYAS
jgi:poly(3-hydroxybutyrate) depolymerase